MIDYIIIYRQPKVILGGSAVMLTFGLGHTTGMTFFAKSMTGRMAGFRFKDGRRIFMIYLNIISEPPPKRYFRLPKHLVIYIPQMCRAVRLIDLLG